MHDKQLMWQQKLLIRTLSSKTESFAQVIMKLTLTIEICRLISFI